MMNHVPEKLHGFTLIEMLVTVTILAILASAVFPLAHIATQRSKETQLRQALLDLRSAIDGYKRAADTGHIVLKTGDSGYPPRLGALVDGVDDAKPPLVNGAFKPGKLYFLRRIPDDPMSDDTDAQATSVCGPA